MSARSATRAVARARRCAAFGDLGRHLAVRVHEQLVPGLDQVAAIGAPMMPRPMKPSLKGCGRHVVSLGRFSARASRSSQPRPASVLLAGLYSQPTQPRVADAVEVREQEAVVDLAGARLVAARVVGELHVRDARQVLLQRRGQLAFHALRVVDVVLHVRVVGADLVEDRQRLRRAAQVEAGDVEGVDRLDQQPDARLLQLGRGVAQVGDEGAAQRRVARAERRLAGQAVELLHAERARVVDRLRHAVAELVDPIGQAGDAALAGVPVAAPAGCAARASGRCARAAT